MKTKSMWGKPPKRLYKLIKLAENDFGRDINACIVGCSDGKFLLPFSRKHYRVVGYDIDEIALYGGNEQFPIVNKKIKYKYDKNFISQKYDLETKKVLGVVERLKQEGLSKYAKIEKRDFYKSKNTKKFNVVFTSCSLHYSINKDLTLKEKIKRLQDIVVQAGYLYIDYMIATEDADYEQYSKNKFYRTGEMAKYFDKNWKIIFIRENSQPTFEGAHVDRVTDHFHKFGYILAKKIK